jgi:predicted nucleic acid-binding protein
VLVVDANIAIKFVTQESGRDEVYDRIDRENALIAPDWILIEAGHALWRKVKMDLLDRHGAEQCLNKLPSFFEDLVSAAPLIGSAQKLAFALDHWIYDCFYLALALERDVPLLTADRKFANAAARAGYAETVELLTWSDQAQ